MNTRMVTKEDRKCFESKNNKSKCGNTKDKCDVKDCCRLSKKSKP